MTWITNRSIVLAMALMVSAGLASLIPVKAESAQNETQSTPVKLAAIESITTIGEGDAAALIIKLSTPATYTSYKTTAPLRLVVDLSQTTQGTIASPLVINKGNFKTVTVSRYDTDAGVLTRIDIELLKDSEAVLSASQENPGELKISFPALIEHVITEKSLSGIPAVPVATDGKEIPPPTTTPSAEPVAVSSSLSGTPPASAPNVTRQLTAVSVKDNLIVLVIDGGAAEFKTFRLGNPERFVVDMHDVKSALAARIIPVNTAGVSSARLGIYPDKVRIVFDAISGSFPETSVAKSADGLTLTLMNKPADENPNTRIVAAAIEKTVTEPVKPVESPIKATPVVEPIAVVPPVSEKPVVQEATAPQKSVAPSAVHASVEMIDFQVVGGISRVAVKVSGDVSAEAPIKSPGFVTLTIKNALLPKRLQRSLETKGFISPVLRVTPILVKTHKGTDTKIRIAMRKAASYEYRQEGDMLFVDFNNPEGIPAAIKGGGLNRLPESDICTTYSIPAI